MLYDITIIIPFLNEEENLETLVAALNACFADVPDIRVECIFVDDGSTDNSVPILKRCEHTSYHARIIKLSKNYGSHAALRAGILHAASTYITFLYADLQDPIDLVIRLYHKCQKGNDIVWAVRRNIRSNWLEKAFSRAYAKLMQKFAVKNYPEKGFDIVMFNAKVRNTLNQSIEIHSSIFLQILTLGFKQDCIEYDKQARKVGTSKWTLSKKIKLFIDSFVAFSYFPIRLVSFVGILLSCLGFLWAFYLVVRTLLYHDLEPGWPSLIAILMLGFGLTNISLGIIAEYLWRTLDASRNRKAFIIDEIIELP